MNTKASPAGVELVTEVHQDAADLGRCAHLLTQHTVIFAPTRTGMSAGPILPQVLNLAGKPKS